MSLRVAASTWSVEKDGSGDFTVIQDAVNAASSGDTISIGPGWYDDYQTYESYGNLFDINIYIQEPIDLTFVGSGASQTIIGPVDPLVPENGTYGIATLEDVNLRIQDLGVYNCRKGCVYVSAASAVIEQCDFVFQGDVVYSDDGVAGGFLGGGTVRDCRFEGFTYGLSTINSPGGVLVEDSGFVDCTTGIYAWTPGSAAIIVERCDFDCTIVGISYLAGAGGIVTNSSFRDCMLSLGVSGVVEVRGCNLTRSDGGHVLSLNNVDPVIMERNIFKSNGNVVRCGSYGGGIIRENQFIRAGGEYWIYSVAHPESTFDVDFSGNYWGTTNVEEISEGIWDCYDDPNAYNCVIFEPLGDIPLPVDTAATTTRMSPPYPNPFNPSTTIRYELESAREIDLSIYNVKGGRVATIASGVHQAGAHSVAWQGIDRSGRRVPSGVYFARLVAGDVAQTERLVLVQ